MNSLRSVNLPAIATLGCITLLYLAMVYPVFNHNDFMYAVAPIFVDDLRLYKDLEFVQAPGSVWLYGIIYEMAGDESFYAALRLVSFSFLVAAGVMLFLTCVSLTNSTTAYLIPIFLVSSPVMVSIAEEIGSTTIGLLFFSIAMYVYFAKAQTARTLAFVGVMIGLAATAKLNFALFAVPFGIFVAWDRGLRSKETVSYCIGGIAGSALIWRYFFADPSYFWFFNIEFHYLMNVERDLGPEDSIPTIAQMLYFFIQKSISQFCICLSAIFLLKRAAMSSVLSKIFVLFVFSIAAALSPFYFAPQYFGASALLLALMASICAGNLASKLAINARAVWIAIFGISLLSAMPYLSSRLSKSAHAYSEQRSAVTMIASMRDRIEKIAETHLTGSDCNMNALSLSAVPFIGTSFNIEPFSSTGPFMPLVAEQIIQFAPEFKRYAELDSRIAEIEPTAVLVGYYPELKAEREISRYASTKEFVAFDVGELNKFWAKDHYPSLVLLLRKTCITRRTFDRERTESP